MCKALLKRMAGQPFPALIVEFTTAVLTVGVFSSVFWLGTGRIGAVSLFFDYAGAICLILLSLAGLGLSLLARMQFSRGEPLRSVWSLVSLGAGAQVLGGILSQVLGSPSGLNPFARDPSWPLPAMLNWGLTIGGPLQMALLAAGLALALRAYRRSGLLPRFSRIDWVLMSVVAGFAVWRMYEVVLYYRPGKITGIHEAVNLLTDPLLSLLLVEAMLIRRSVLNMGRGLIARCWSAFAAAIFLIAAGNIGLWLAHNFEAPVPLAASTWYLGFLVNAAYALAPAYQLEACRRATHLSVLPRRPSSEARKRLRRSNGDRPVRIGLVQLPEPGGSSSGVFGLIGRAFTGRPIVVSFPYDVP